MGLSGRKQPRRVVKRYGLGSAAAVISLPVSFLMASRGMNGWQEKAARDAEADAIEMARRGYRVASSDERSVPYLGIYWVTVTYELGGQGR